MYQANCTNCGEQFEIDSEEMELGASECRACGELVIANTMRVMNAEELMMSGCDDEETLAYVDDIIREWDNV